MATSTLDLNDFADVHASKQLEIIDKLRELGVGEDVSLPQLVVVGDQSSGKSSLLEGLTGLEFPTASQLCTRFATQVSFRRTAPGSPENIVISIVPAPGSHDRHSERLKAFTQNISELSIAAFAETLDNAAGCMGLPTKSCPNSGKRFSSDVLKFEISGPTQQHLSIVDVPGLYHNPTQDQTKEDLELIRALIQRYLRESCTIIIAVLNATNNLANQEVFKIAREVDKKGIRTIGVMTKLDALQQGDEVEILKIAKNESFALTHGWFCVRNRTTKEVLDGVGISLRHEKERQFFATKPWSSLQSSRLGTLNLKASLGKLLAEHVAREFPRIRDTISTELEACESQMQLLGPPRRTFQEQMQHLAGASISFQALADMELRGHNLHLSQEPGTHVMLRTRVQKAYEDFNNNMQRVGRTIRFRRSHHTFKCPRNSGLASASGEHDSDVDYSEQDGESSDEPAAEGNGHQDGGNESDEIDEPDKDDGSKEDRYHDHASRSSRPTPTALASKAMRQDIYLEIFERWSNSRGTELPGQINPSIMEILFGFQTEEWMSITTGHLEKIMDLVVKCYERLLKRVLGGSEILKRLTDALEPEKESIMEKTKQKLLMILDGERTGPLHTTNHYYATNVEKYRADRVKASDKDNHLGNQESAVYTIHDSLKSYYKVALKRFIDNFGVYVVEQELLGSKGPLSLFSPQWVAALDDEELAEIAGEDRHTALTRSNLELQISRLRQAHEICGKKRKVDRSFGRGSGKKSRIT